MARHAPARSPGSRVAERLPFASRRSSGIRLGVGALVLLLLGGLVAAVVVTLSGGAGQVTTLPDSGTPTATASAPSGAVVYIHVLGAVSSPGVYRFRDGDRVVDAIAAAGGYTAEADPQAVNLARFLSDGEQILVPVRGAAPPPGEAAPGGEGAQVNLNTATSSELETLPRIGPAMAERIIAWRDENGGFTSVDDLLGVAGIGDKTFEGLRDLVTV